MAISTNQFRFGQKGILRHSGGVCRLTRPRRIADDNFAERQSLGWWAGVEDAGRASGTRTRVRSLTRDQTFSLKARG